MNSTRDYGRALGRQLWSEYVKAAARDAASAGGVTDLNLVKQNAKLTLLHECPGSIENLFACGAIGLDELLHVTAKLDREIRKIEREREQRQPGDPPAGFWRSRSPDCHDTAQATTRAGGARSRTRSPSLP